MRLQASRIVAQLMAVSFSETVPLLAGRYTSSFLFGRLLSRSRHVRMVKRNFASGRQKDTELSDPSLVSHLSCLDRSEQQFSMKRWQDAIVLPPPSMSGCFNSVASPSCPANHSEHVTLIAPNNSQFLQLQAQIHLVQGRVELAAID